MKAVVIGGGIAGVSAAHALSVETHGGSAIEVTLVEAEPVLAHHTTGRSAAQLILNYGARPIRALTRASLDFLHHPPESLVDHALLDARGRSDRGLRRPACGGRSGPGRGSGHQPGDPEITVAEAVDRFPPLRSTWVDRAILEPDSYDIDVAGLHQAFVRGLKAAGGTIRVSARVVDLERTANRWRVVLDDGEQLTADVVVNAAGAWGDLVAGWAGVDPVGLQPMRRTAFMTPSRHDGSGSGRWSPTWTTAGT